MVDPERAKQSALAITSSGIEAPSLRKSSLLEREGKKY